jgi:hypothetical protein
MRLRYDAEFTRTCAALWDLMAPTLASDEAA